VSYDLTHFAGDCKGQLERAGLDAVCDTCKTRYRNAYGRPLRGVLLARRLCPDERATANAFALELAERRQPALIPTPRPPVFPAETLTEGAHA